MADAIHKTETGDSLQDVAEAYYSLRRPDDTFHDVHTNWVIQGIRGQTPTDLSAYADTDALPLDTVLFVPTFRGIDTAVVEEDQALRDDLAAAGLRSGRHLIERDVEDVVTLLSPVPVGGYDEEDIRRAWRITTLVDLDGMDIYTARHLHDVQIIQELSFLATQSEATLDGILQGLVTNDARPAELTQQGHSLRWATEARLRTRNKLGELARAQVFQVPFVSSLAADRARFYEGAARGRSRDGASRGLARSLALLHRAQEAILDGNLAVLAGQWRRGMEQA